MTLPQMPQRGHLPTRSNPSVGQRGQKSLGDFACPTAGYSHSSTPYRIHERRLFRPAAQVVDRTFLAQRPLRLANVAPMQDQPMMGVETIGLRHHLFELVLDFER